MLLEKRFASLIQQAGITVNGTRPFDMQVHDPRTYSAILRRGTLGAGESYMDGWWSCDRLDEFSTRVMSSGLHYDDSIFSRLTRDLLAKAINFQSTWRADEVAKHHYDLDPDIFRAMLDRELVYTCAYWRSGAQNLEDAQIAKLDLVCKKLGLKPGMKVLDIGCGFGAFMKHASKNYGAHCVGYTISESQAKVAREKCSGLPVEIRVQDYREIKGLYDRVVSIGMFEAVGYKNFREYMNVVERSLHPDGLFLLHTIGHNLTRLRGDPWLTRYIFPNGMLPSIAGIGKSVEGLFVMEDWHNFGPDYALTLLEWNRRFQAAWPSLSNRYPERFKRMWEYYLLVLVGGFQSRTWQLWQIVFSKPGRAQPECRFT